MKIKTIKDLQKFMANTDWTSFEFSEEDKKKFLFFCTGSDRVPILGLKSLKFHISRMGPDSEQ